MQSYLTVAGLAAITGLVLLLPLSVKKVEEELEAFLLLMGFAAVTISDKWSGHLILEALNDPLPISAAVLITGFAFKAARTAINAFIARMLDRLGVKLSVFVIITALGFGSSVITAIIAALVLAEVVTSLRLDRETEIKIVIYACYAIGLGAVLTPIGEPLSTITTAKLKGPPHNADFLFLFLLTWKWIVPGVLGIAALAASACKCAPAHGRTLAQDSKETAKSVLLRAAKVYIFVMALTFLGTGLRPLAEATIALAPDWALYWLNMVSAILDNATLAAAEIVPQMPEHKILFVLMGLLVSGGMLIPGNIPNIISASKLGIKSKEWAKSALPFGLALMCAYFILLMLAR